MRAYPVAYPTASRKYASCPATAWIPAWRAAKGHHMGNTGNNELGTGKNGEQSQSTNQQAGVENGGDNQSIQRRLAIGAHLILSAKTNVAPKGDDADAPKKIQFGDLIAPDDYAEAVDWFVDDVSRRVSQIGQELWGLDMIGDVYRDKGISATSLDEYFSGARAVFRSMRQEIFQLQLLLNGRRKVGAY